MDNICISFGVVFLSTKALLVVGVASVMRSGTEQPDEVVCSRKYGSGMDSVCLEFTIQLPCDAPEWSGLWFAYCRRVRTWSSCSAHGLFLP